MVFTVEVFIYGLAGMGVEKFLYWVWQRVYRTFCVHAICTHVVRHAG